MTEQEINLEIDTLRGERSELRRRIDMIDDRIAALLANENSIQSRYRRLMKQVNDGQSKDEIK